VTALKTDPQMEPKGAGLQAVLATDYRLRQSGNLDMGTMPASCHHPSPCQQDRVWHIARTRVIFGRSKQGLTEPYS